MIKIYFFNYNNTYLYCILTACCIFRVFALQICIKDIQRDFHFLETQRRALIIKEHWRQLPHTIMNKYDRRIREYENLIDNWAYAIFGDVTIIER